ncbi:hypothetical protein WR25_07057 [Diploscapter pachys]|uniref:RRM domain-containing protein n=1 Tax=Diploscapter pachys TaxID=2018661 RepID=A0A2A2JRW7_9BILA|nr:hypothetical protein WR25_07057 [Diploscapter pachys]
MVKLFVGNLTDHCEANKLKQVFQQFTKVTGCDVVKNYAFVHIEDENPLSTIDRLNGYVLDGKPILVQISKPGLEDSTSDVSDESNSSRPKLNKSGNGSVFKSPGRIIIDGVQRGATTGLKFTPKRLPTRPKSPNFASSQASRKPFTPKLALPNDGAKK